MGRVTLIGALVLALAGCMETKETTPAAPVVSSQNIPAAMRGVPAKQLFGAAPQGSAQVPAPLGSYARGCLAGGGDPARDGPHLAGDAAEPKPQLGPSRGD